MWTLEEKKKNEKSCFVNILLNSLNRRSSLKYNVTSEEVWGQTTDLKIVLSEFVYYISAWQSHLNLFESQKYCAVEIIVEIILVFCGKDQHRKTWCLISLKRITGVSYLVIFTQNGISRKKADFFLSRKNMCWFKKTVQQHGAKNGL